MRAKLVIVTALLLIGLADPVSAIITPTTADAFSPTFLLAANQYSGVGRLDFVVRQPNALGIGSFSCTGSLISSTEVLTAGHCFGGSALPKLAILSVDFVLDGPSGPRAFRVDGFAQPDGFTGDAGVGSDLAIARLATAAPAAASIYSIYRGDGEYGVPFAKVGAGWYGAGNTGAIGFDGRRRVVANSYDLNQETLYGGDFGAPADSVLLYDFDDGSDVHDTFGKYFGVGDRGIFIDGELREGSPAQYDSGGPAFIGGLIAGITSYVDGPAGFEGGCGPGFSDGHPTSTDPGACFDQSFGEWAADTRVSRFQDFVDAGLGGSLVFANPVPEPSAWGMMIAGLGFAGASLRFRRSRTRPPRLTRASAVAPHPRRPAGARTGSPLGPAVFAGLTSKGGIRIQGQCSRSRTTCVRWWASGKGPFPNVNSRQFVRHLMSIPVLKGNRKSLKSCDRLSGIEGQRDNT